MPRFEVILQHDWPIEQCLLHIRVFFGRKTKSPSFNSFIHWLIKQITNTYQKKFSRSYKNRSTLQFDLNHTVISLFQGASIIRMLQDVLGKDDSGKDVFFKGLQHYLKKYSFSNAETNDLWRCLEQAKQGGKVISTIPSCCK